MEVLIHPSITSSTLNMMMSREVKRMEEIRTMYTNDERCERPFILMVSNHDV